MRNPLLWFIFLVFAVDSYWIAFDGSTGIVITLSALTLALTVVWAIIEIRKNRIKS